MLFKGSVDLEKITMDCSSVDLLHEDEKCNER